jgi:hypothetical protein
MSFVVGIGSLAVFALLIFGVEAASAGSAPVPTMSGGPADMRVELNNSALTVVRIRLAPHEKTPMHDVTARLVVWLSDADIRDTFADGHSDELRRSVGTIDWVPAERHAGENLTDNPIEFLAIIPKTE